MLQFTPGLVVVKLKLRVPVIHVGELFVLQLGLLAQSEVLDHDVTLDLRDILLSLFDGISAEVIKKLRIVSIDLLFLALAILSTLLLHLVIQTEQHFVTVFLVLNLLLLDQLGVLELEQLLLGLQQLLHLPLLVLQFALIALANVYLLVIESSRDESQALFFQSMKLLKKVTYLSFS